MEQQFFEEKHYYDLLWNAVWGKASENPTSKMRSKDGIITQLEADTGVSTSTLWRYDRGHQKPQKKSLNAFLTYLGHIDFDAFKKQVDLDEQVRRKKGEIIDQGLQDDFQLRSIYFSLKNSSDFLGSVHNLLFSFYPGVQRSKIGPFQFVHCAQGSANIDFAFSILDFNGALPDSTVETVCIELFRKIEAVDRKIGTFTLILNVATEVNNPVFDKVLQYLKSLVKRKYINEQSDVLDLEGFIIRYDRKMEVEIRDRLWASSIYFKKECSRILEQTFYLEDVPFQSHVRNVSERNPLASLRNELNSIDPKRPLQPIALINASSQEFQIRESNWTFIISEFGYGKTSLLQNLALEFTASSKVQCLFVPMAQLAENAFNSVYEFVQSLVEFVFLKSIDTAALFDQMATRSLQNSLSKRQDILLLLDGLDEHHFAYELPSLTRIFDCIKSIETECLITVRKELWEDKQGNFNAVFKRSKKHKEVVELTEWTNDDIEAFLAKLKMKKLSTSERTSVEEFKKVVETGEYEKFYGDIPKRPLFLELILKDVIAENIHKVTLSTLYENYVRDKFLRDREGVFVRNTTSRMLRLENEEDRTKVFNKICQVVKKIAALMISSNPKHEAVLLSYVDEEQVESLGLLSSGKITITEILLNSVLVPFGARKDFQSFKMKFSHRSFQEFFTAWFLIDLLESPSNFKSQISLYALKYSAGVRNFCADFFNRRKANWEVVKISAMLKSVPSAHKNSLSNILMKGLTLDINP